MLAKPNRWKVVSTVTLLRPLTIQKRGHWWRGFIISKPLLLVAKLRRYYSSKTWLKSIVRLIMCYCAMINLTFMCLSQRISPIQDWLMGAVRAIIKKVVFLGRFRRHMRRKRRWCWCKKCSRCANVPILFLNSVSARALSIRLSVAVRPAWVWYRQKNTPRTSIIPFDF